MLKATKKIKKKFEIVSFKTYVTCRCCFFQLVVITISILIKLGFFIVMEQRNEEYEIFIQMNKQIQLNSTMLSNINMIENVGNNLSEGLVMINEQNQIYETHSAVLTNVGDFCLFANYTSCSLYGYNSEFINNYLNNTDFQDLIWQYTYIGISTYSGGNYYSDNFETYYDQALAFWNQAYMILPHLSGMMRSFNENYTGFLTKVSQVKVSTDSQTEFEISYPGDSSQASSSAGYNYRQNLALTESSFTAKTPYLVKNPSVDSGLYLFYKLDSGILIIAEISYSYILNTFTSTESNSDLRWFIVDEDLPNAVDVSDSVYIRSPSVNTTWPDWRTNDFQNGLKDLVPETSTLSSNKNSKNDCVKYGEICNLWYSDQIDLSFYNDQIGKTKFWLLAYVKLSNAELNSTTKAAFTSFRYIDMLGFSCTCLLVCFAIVSQFNQIYYIIFSQLNLFTYLLNNFSNEMLKDSQKMSSDDFKSDMMIFREDHEFKDFIEIFFEFFRKNREYNYLNLEKEFSQGARDVINEKLFIRKFNENILGPIKENYTLFIHTSKLMNFQKQKNMFKGSLIPDKKSTLLKI